MRKREKKMKKNEIKSIISLICPKFQSILNWNSFIFTGKKNTQLNDIFTKNIFKINLFAASKNEQKERFMGKNYTVG